MTTPPRLRMRRLITTCEFSIRRTTRRPPQSIKPRIAKRREIMRTLFGHSLYWACQIACWGGLWALFFFIFISGSTRQLPAPHLIEQTLYCSFGLIATHLLRILFDWFDWNRLPPFSLSPCG